jgi:hypothetical protein
MSYSPAQMLAHCRARHLANAASQPVASWTDVPIAGNGAPAAVVAQARGFANFTKLSVVRRVVSLPSTTRSSSNTPAPSTPTTPSLGSGTLTPILSNLITLPSSTVFSSSKETCILRRSLLSAGLLEGFQVLKHLYKEERIDFTSYWIANEDDYSIEKATTTAINEPTLASSSAKHELHDELLDLLHSMDNARIQ